MKTTSLIRSLPVREHRTFLVVLLWVGLAFGPALTQTTFADHKGQQREEKDFNHALTQTAFIYQGQLKDGGVPASGTYDFQFTLYTAQTGGDELGSIVHEGIVLTNGLFKVKLDFGHAAVEGQESWLKIAVRPSGGSELYTVLSPRQRLTPTPYAIFAQQERWSLIGVPVGFPSDVEGAKGVDAVKEEETPATASTTAAAPQGTPNFVAKFDSRGVATLDSIMFDNGTKIGIGTMAPQATFEIHQLINPSSPSFAVKRGGRSPSFDFIVDNLGNVGIGTTTPQHLLDLGSSIGRKLAVFQNSAGNNFHGFGVSTDAKSLLFYAGAPGGFLSLPSMVLTEEGKLGIGPVIPTRQLEVLATQGVARLTTSSSSFGSVLELKNNASSPTFLGAINFLTSADAVPGQIAYLGTTNEMTFRTNGAERMRIDSSGNVTVSVLQITGGSDLAEPFEVSRAETIEPGMVVAIDPEQPGRLRLADKAYDRTVAGIISGANGINPGLTLKQEGTVADGSLPVSLTGRVYCWADASYGAIEPGNLLTTSDTPGHAMKVTNHKKAQGAIIGKAMTELKRGKGLVLVLVSLQ